jgi:Flp pilus assembly protein TadD
VSLILDTLRHRSPQSEGSGAPRTARGDAVLATLGYSKRMGQNGPSMKSLLLFGAGAIVLGFVGLALLITVLAPPAPGNQSTLAQRSGGSPAPARAPAAAPRATEFPRVPAADAPETEPNPTAPISAAASDTTAGKAEVPSVAPPASTRAQPAPRRPVLPSVGSEPASIPAQASTAPTDDFGQTLLQHRLGNFENASYFSATVLKDGPTAAVHNNEGVLFIDKGESGAAIIQLMEALALDPKYVKAQNNLGVAFLNEGRLDEATKALNMALTQEPRNVESMVNLALVHKAAGRSADARDLLQRAVAVEPRSAGAHYNLAVVADEAGDTAVAAEHYRAFLRLDSGRNTNLMAPVRARLNALGR